MIKNNKGSVTLMAFVAMLFISLYGAVILGTSAREYQNQTNNINTIIASYRFQGATNGSTNGQMLNQQELENLYYNVGGQRVVIIKTNIGG